MGLTKSKVSTLKLQRVNFKLFKAILKMKSPGTLYLGTKELNRAAKNSAINFEGSVHRGNTRVSLETV